MRGGVKYKMLADRLYAEGKPVQEIEAAIKEAKNAILMPAAWRRKVPHQEDDRYFGQFS